MESSFLMPNISLKLKRDHAKRRRQLQVYGGRLNVCAVAANWRLSTRSVVNLARSQVEHTERSPYSVGVHVSFLDVSSYRNFRTK